MLWNFVLILHFFNLIFAQYCNEEIVVEKVIQVEKTYEERELYKKVCPFDVSSNTKSCPFWRNVTKTKLEDKILKQNMTIIRCCKGYHLVNGINCLPYCKDACVNGICSSPGNCSCLEGFAKSLMISNICDPICQSCNHGECVAPNECKCHEGYTKNASKCEPFCENCGVGICEHPYRCKCHDGYKKDDNGACTIKSCPTDCSGGSCVDGKCECNEGLEWVDEEFACIPFCPTIPTTEASSEITVNFWNNETSTEESSAIDMNSNRDILIWALVVIIAILGLALVSILGTIWYRKRYSYQDDSFRIRYNTDHIIIQQRERKY